MTQADRGNEQRPLILLTNDDGYDAPGLLALAVALQPIAEVAVIAPDHNWSASGHSRTLFTPIHTRTVTLADGSPATSTTGSPADCVALALLGLVARRPNLVISGINRGANVGSDLTYSGTVAGARESAFAGIVGVAASLDTLESADFGPAARFIARLAQRLLANAPAEPLLLNVNIPALPEEQIRGVQITRLGQRIYRDELVRREDPRGQPYYWIGGQAPTGVPAPGTDIGALATGYISITPLLLDPTNHAQVDLLRGLAPDK